MEDARKVANWCAKNLNLDEAELMDEYFYQSLPLCVIDAVFSIGANYTSTSNTVIKYCNYFDLQRIRSDKDDIPPKEEQQSISNFLSKMDQYGLQTFTEEIFDNRQLTSPKNGIRKTKAVYKFAKVLRSFNVDYFQDISKALNNSDFKRRIKEIPGQTSGKSLNYFFMLSGCDEFIKPDRMIRRCLENILNKKVNQRKTQEILSKTSNILNQEYDYGNITPRLLDHQIWKYQRDE